MMCCGRVGRTPTSSAPPGRHRPGLPRVGAARSECHRRLGYSSAYHRLSPCSDRPARSVCRQVAVAGPADAFPQEPLAPTDCSGGVACVRLLCAGPAVPIGGAARTQGPDSPAARACRGGAPAAATDAVDEHASAIVFGGSRRRDGGYRPPQPPATLADDIGALGEHYLHTGGDPMPDLDPGPATAQTVTSLLPHEDSSRPGNDTAA